MSLPAFKENFVERLRGTVRDNLHHYKSPKSWVFDVFERKSCVFSTKIIQPSMPSLSLPTAEDLKDLENSILVHKAFPHLSPVGARDPRLWTYLTHVDCWEYMRSRWDIERTDTDHEKAAKFVVSRYFIANNESRALMRNGLARLWWIGHLTYDPDRENPYALTEVLLSSLDIAQTILERNLGRARDVTHGILEFLQENKGDLIGPGDVKRLRVRRLVKSLNLIGGVTLLDCLSKPDVKKYLRMDFERIMAEERD